MNSRSPSAMRKSIIDFLARAPRDLFRAKEIAHAIGLRGRSDYADFKEILEQMVSAGTVKLRKKGYYGSASRPSVLQGVLEVTRQGFGFVEVEGEERDIFVPARSMSTALDGDRVEIALSPKKPRSERDAPRAEGEILRVLERAHPTLVGTVDIRRREALMTPDDQRFPAVSITNTEALRGVSSGEKVIVRIDSWGEGEPELSGTMLETLGRSGDLAVEVRSVLRDFALTAEFPPDVARETQDVGDPRVSPVGARRDLEVV